MKCAECRWFSGRRCEVSGSIKTAGSTACSYLSSRDYSSRRCSCCNHFNARSKRCEINNTIKTAGSTACSYFSRY